MKTLRNFCITVMVIFFSACSLVQLSEDELVGTWGEVSGFPSTKGAKECAIIEFHPYHKFVAFNLPIKYFGSWDSSPAIRVKRAVGEWALNTGEYPGVELDFRTEGIGNAVLPIIEGFPPEFYTWAGADESDVLRFTRDKNSWCIPSP